MAEITLQPTLQRAWDRFCRRWEPRYGQGHAWFACHAAFPVLVTPDLLYQLWFNFRLYEKAPGEWAEIDPMAVSDLLLSGLFPAVGPEVYEVPAPLRGYLLEKLKAHFGPERLPTLGAFLEAYRSARATPEEDGNLREIWHWTAETALRPEAAARSLAGQLGQAFQQGGKGRQMQLSLLVDQLGENTPELQELKVVAKGMLNPGEAIHLPEFHLSDLPSDGDLMRLPMPPDLRKRLSRPGLPLNQARDLQWKIAEARNQKTLDLSGLGLETLPDELAEMTHLEELDLKNNQLTRLPEWLIGFTQLKRLRISRNQLTDFLPYEGGLPALEELTFNNNQLTEFPSSLFTCPRLRKLLLGNNKIAYLPEYIGQLLHLEHLDLGHNRLSEIPEFPYEILNLRFLYLSDNQLTRLPERIGNLHQLEILQAHNNALSELPPSLREIAPKLLPNDHKNPWRRGLRLEGNSFPGNLPDSFWSRSPVEIVEAILGNPVENARTGVSTLLLCGVTPTSLGQDSQQYRELLQQEMQAISSYTPSLDPFAWQLEVLPDTDWTSIEAVFALARNEGSKVAVLHYGSFVDGLAAMYEAGYSQKLDLPSWLAAQNGLKLVFLNTCDSYADAQSVYRAGVGAVIGIEGTLPDDAAVEFAREFYRLLIQGEALGKAFRQAERYMLAWGEGRGTSRKSAGESTETWSYRHHLLAREEMMDWRMKGREDAFTQRPVLRLFWEEEAIMFQENPISQQNSPMSYLETAASAEEVTDYQWLSSAISLYPDRLQRTERQGEADAHIQSGPDGLQLQFTSLSFPPFSIPAENPTQTQNWLVWMSRFYTLLTLENPVSEIATGDFEVSLGLDDEEEIPLYPEGLYLPEEAGIERLVLRRLEGKDGFWMAAWAEMNGRIRALQSTALPFLGRQELVLPSPVYPARTPGTLLILVSGEAHSPLEVLAQDPVNGNLGAKTSFIDQPEIPTRPDWQLFRWPIHVQAGAGSEPLLA